MGTAVHVGCFTRLWVGHPRAVMLCCFLTISAFSGLTLLKEFREPVNTGWTNDAHRTIQRLDVREPVSIEQLSPFPSLLLANR